MAMAPRVETTAMKSHPPLVGSEIAQPIHPTTAKIGDTKKNVMTIKLKQPPVAAETSPTTTPCHVANYFKWKHISPFRY
jgi:hypothetical protein